MRKRNGDTGVRRFDMVGLGYTALDYLGIIPHFPEQNKKLELREFLVQGGGPAATAAVTARRLGLSVSFIGKVGDDYPGERMLSELVTEGVDCSSVIVEHGAASQFAFIMVDAETGARTILWTRGTVSPIETPEVDLGLVISAGALLVDSLEPTAARAAARAAREEGIPVVMDAGTVREGVAELLPLCDFIVASEVFAGQISEGGGAGEALRSIFALGAEAAVVTLGERGCMALTGDGMIEVPGFPVRAVDTTGAGDVFHGAFLCAVLEGWDPYRMCLFANAVAAMKCRRLGGRAGIPSRAEALAFLHERRPDITFRTGPPGGN
ncbi:MAG TPA: PfkB family carbohydrate kinase [Patescibacteria group bacterium]|nr:PfkB family carbohydrate kinase [Patescibacteria group bacterium]